MVLVWFPVEHFPYATNPRRCQSGRYTKGEYSLLFLVFGIVWGISFDHEDIYDLPSTTSGYHMHNTASIWYIHSHMNTLIYTSFGRYPSQHSWHAHPSCKLSRYSRDARPDDILVGTWFSVCTWEVYRPLLSSFPLYATAVALCAHQCLGPTSVSRSSSSSFVQIADDFRSNALQL